MNNSNAEKTRRCNLVGLMAISVLGLLIYSNSLSGAFVFDDRSSILNNPLIRDVNIPIIYSSYSTRFLPYLSFAFNYMVGGLEVGGYHLFNVFIHILASLAVWRLALLVFRTGTDAPSTEREMTRLSQYRCWLALFAGLIFVAHPVQTQSVSYIVQRMTSMAALFYIATVWLYGETRRRQTSASPKPVTAWLLYGLALVCGLAAVHCKEHTVTLPAAVLLYEICIVKRRRQRELLCVIPFVAVALIVPFYMLGGGVSISAIQKATTETETISRTTYLLTEFRVLVTYLRLLVLPVNQNLDYDYALATGFFEPRIFFSFLLLSVIGIAGILAYRRNRILTFCVFWFYIALSVESTIIPIRDVIYEHRLYLPMVAYALLLPCAVLFFVTRDSEARIRP